MSAFRTFAVSAAGTSLAWGSSVNLMTGGLLGDFEDEDWEGYACTFLDWATCVNSTSVKCDDPESTCRTCTSRRSGKNESISCTQVGGQTQFRFPPGGIFPALEQFTIPPNTAIVGAENPNDPSDKTRQQTQVASQTWFVVPKSVTLCGDDPWCSDESAKGPTACSGDPRIHRQGFLMSSGSTLKDVNFQGGDLGRAASEGTLCGPGVIELPGCLSGTGCKTWQNAEVTGEGVVRDVVVQNVRLSDAVKRADIAQMGGDCNAGEALDADGNHVRAHQVSVWVSKLPDSETEKHSNILIDNLVSMNSRADGLNVHGAVQGLTLQHSYIANSGDDCIGIWSAGAENVTIQDLTAANCAVTAGAQTNWGSCMGTYAFQSVTVDGMKCYDPVLDSTGCNPRTHWTAIHLNHAFANDCMPLGASLSLSGIEYFASQRPDMPLQRPKCGQCRSCCGGGSYAGFDALTISYLDASVPEGTCMTEDAGCGGGPAPPAPPAPPPTPAPSGYIGYAGRNACIGHGGDPIDGLEPVASGVSSQECTALCGADSRCSCVTLSSAGGQCWLRSSCAPGGFEEDARFDVYYKRLSEFTDFPGKNAYHGHGGEPIDEDDVPAASGLSSDECKGWCDAEVSCSCATFGNAFGECYLRSDCVAAEFDEDQDYSTYLKNSSRSSASLLV